MPKRLASGPYIGLGLGFRTRPGGFIFHLSACIFNLTGWGWGQEATTCVRYKCNCIAKKPHVRINQIQVRVEQCPHLQQPLCFLLCRSVMLEDRLGSGERRVWQHIWGKGLVKPCRWTG